MDQNLITRGAVRIAALTFPAQVKVKHVLYRKNFFFSRSLSAEVDVVGLVQCTSPFIRTEELEEAVEKMNLGLYDSIFSVTRSHCLRWKEDSNALL